MAQIDDPEEWSDAPDTMDEDHYDSHPRGIEEVEIGDGQVQGLAVQGVKITTDQSKDEDNSPVLESSRGPSVSTNAEQPLDTASAHSLPTVQVTDTDRLSARRPSTAHTTLTTTSPVPPDSPVRSTMSHTSSLNSQERRHRHRSAVEPRSASRLSGFFTNLIHRREPVPNNNPLPETIREDRPSSSNAALSSNSNPPSRSTSPPPPRPVTPPPQLPPPTLRELGLSLSVLTSDLSPSHFSTPPTSGAFMAPHYLLLCHAQGLDVLPLVSPPAPQPYALVRRVCFKSVVVMEQRGVLVAIAGRRDGVRVYALEEVKKAVEWRIEVEIRRERERSRREAAKKVALSLEYGIDPRDIRASSEKGKHKNSFSTASEILTGHDKPTRKSTQSSSAQTALIPRTPTTRRPKTPPSSQVPQMIPEPLELPPPYPSPPPTVSSLSIEPRLRAQSSVVSIRQSRPRSGSVTNVLAAAPTSRSSIPQRDQDSKADWTEDSDDEAINVVVAASSGSQALDERTSSTTSPRTPPGTANGPTVPLARNPTSSLSVRRNRPANLDLSLTRSNTNTSPVVPPEPSPTPTLITLRQALQHVPDTADSDLHHDLDTPIPEGEGEGEGGGDDEDEIETDGRITLAQALLESRIPDLPPAGSRQSQQPILITSSHPVASADDEPSSPRISDAQSAISRRSNATDRPRRRRWSVLDGMFSNGNDMSTPSIATSASAVVSTSASTSTSVTNERASRRLSRSQSFRSGPLPSQSPSAPVPRPASSSGLGHSTAVNNAQAPPLPESSSAISTNSRSRFLPRLINAFHNRRSDDNSQNSAQKQSESDSLKRVPAPPAPHAPPPKLEYVKLPGTKGAIMVKSVETAKKSFLAILCGENGEKVELFAGTYRTALGLSRTFILPDSPRSLELQLQGDDLVEVFLVFSQNVFGLEPATVRVREVRIGRAERRAARRRAREIRSGEPGANDDAPSIGEEDTNVNVNIGVSVAVAPNAPAASDADDEPSPSLVPADHPGRPSTPPEPSTSSAIAHAEEVVALATAQMGPYTTFQQLSFAPNFPLACIADEYIIPPTYPDFLDYRATHEPPVNGSTDATDLAHIQFSPPGLPVPLPSAPSKWYYRDPKNIVHGPWKASLMQAWYKDALLPPDLPVRREEDLEYVLLRDLRLQCVDPSHPFRSPPPPLTQQPLIQDSAKPLLSPISLLAQPKHFGPPALFFSSRGGHSTAIVDARGRSVLKGRFLWSSEEPDEDESIPSLISRMGDVKRLEAFDVKDRAVLVALRQGGLEVVDLGDALLKPADESRTVLPQFNPPPSNTNRRRPFVWKIGTPVSTSPTMATVLSSSKPKGGHSHHIPGKKQSTGLSKSPVGRTEFSIGDTESDTKDEVLFLGRKGDEIYICERNAGSFRILRLCPNPS